MKRNTRTWVKESLPFIEENQVYNGGLNDGCGVKISQVSLLLIGGRGVYDSKWRNYKAVTKYVGLDDGENGNGKFVRKNNVKRRQEYEKVILFLDQRWKIDDNMLKNKAKVWTSVDLWIFKPINIDEELFYVIENESEKMVWGATDDDKVIQEVFKEGKANQLWKAGKPDAEGYFTLENFEVPKVITAISESDLEIKGNLILR